MLGSHLCNKLQTGTDPDLTSSSAVACVNARLMGRFALAQSPAPSSPQDFPPARRSAIKALDQAHDVAGSEGMSAAAFPGDREVPGRPARHAGMRDACKTRDARPARAASGTSVLRAVLMPLCATLTLAACTGNNEPEGFISLERNSEFNGQALRFFVTLDDGTEASVHTDEDLIGNMAAPTPLPGQGARALTFFKETEVGTSVAHALLSWDPVDPTDYLTFGWWIQFPDQHLPDLSFKDSEQYAIIDGPELDHGIIPQVPADGTATYTGQAGGLYSYTFGSDWGEDEGEFVIDEYEGVLSLTADFADGTLRGCIGCVGDLVTRRAHFDVFLGLDPIDVQGLAKDYEIHLATAIIREDGQFERDRVTLRHPERTITSFEGRWGGALSSRQDTDGNPRLVAGFNGVYFEESDGSEGDIFGSFLGLSDTFRQDGTSSPLPGNDN